MVRQPPPPAPFHPKPKPLPPNPCPPRPHPSPLLTLVIACLAACSAPHQVHAIAVADRRSRLDGDGASARVLLPALSLRTRSLGTTVVELGATLSLRLELPPQHARSRFPFPPPLTTRVFFEGSHGSPLTARFRWMSGHLRDVAAGLQFIVVRGTSSQQLDANFRAQAATAALPIARQTLRRRRRAGTLECAVRCPTPKWIAREGSVKCVHGGFDGHRLLPIGGTKDRDGHRIEHGQPQGLAVPQSASLA